MFIFEKIYSLKNEGKHAISKRALKGKTFFLRFRELEKGMKKSMRFLAETQRNAQKQERGNVRFDVIASPVRCRETQNMTLAHFLSPQLPISVQLPNSLR